MSDNTEFSQRTIEAIACVVITIMLVVYAFTRHS